MKTFLYISFYLFCSTAVHAFNSPLDSILRHITLENDAKQKISLYNKAAGLVMDTSYTQAAIFISQAMHLSDSLNYEKGRATTLYFEGRNLAFKRNMKKRLKK